jgi:tetratricopeptide (TPR) repeat protein
MSAGTGASAPAADRFARAVEEHRAGRLDAADRLYREVLADDPRHFDALHLHGVIACQKGDDERAIRLLDAALALAPRSPAAHSHRGSALKNLGRWDEALASFDRALALQPDHVDALNNRGNALRALGRTAEALAGYDRAIAIAPRVWNAHHNRGVTLAALGRHAEAVASLDRAAALVPGYAGVHLSRGNALAALERWPEALASYEAALALRPDDPDAIGNRGVALRHLGRDDEALACYDRAIELSSGRADPLCRKGTALLDLQRPDEAVECLERALRVDPDHADARLNLAFAELLRGNFADGCRAYEARWRRRDLRPFDIPPDAPRWSLADSVVGETVLLSAEQGLGDTLQFCRYAAQVAAAGARVVIEVQPALVSLLRGLAGVERVIAKGDARPPFDRQCPLMSLPLACGTRLETIPARVPYLSADDGRVGAWRDRLGPARGRRIGLVWSGHPNHRNDRHRSFPLAAFAPLAALGGEIVSLQTEVRGSDVPALARLGIRHFGSHLTDFAETAALVTLMDEIVAIDTSVAHLAGALGTRVSVLLPFAPDWRWLLERDDSPWYPTAHLFRQAKRGDWSDVIDRVAGMLAAAG